MKVILTNIIINNSNGLYLGIFYNLTLNRMQSMFSRLKFQ